MVDESNGLELGRLIAEADDLRTKLSVARNAHRKDGDKLERLERTIEVLGREIVQKSKV